MEQELIKKYGASRPPDFYNRLPEKMTTTNPCFNCLKETELTTKSGKWRTLPTPLRYWYEMSHAESQAVKKFLQKHKPKKILEIGLGGGRMINLALSAKYPKEIYAMDRNPQTVQIAKQLFKHQKNVHLFEADAQSFLKKKGNFDLALCMMNTLGNIDDQKTFFAIASASKHFLFTLYDKSAHKLRAKIYAARGHSRIERTGTTYCFRDSWVKGLQSKSYSKKEIVQFCEKIGKKYSIKKISKLLFLVHIKGAAQ